MKTLLNIFTVLAMLTSSVFAQDEEAYAKKLEEMSKRGYKAGPYMGWQDQDRYQVGDFPDGAPRCSNGVGPEIGDSRLDDLASNAKGAAKKQECVEARKILASGSRFDTSSCQSAIRCTGYFASLNESKDYGFFRKMGLIVAQDYGKSILKQNMDKMEAFEAVRLFAENKFHTKLDEKCSKKIEDPAAGQGCNVKILDDIYQSYQATCSPAQNSSCYNEKQTNIVSVEDYKRERRKSSMLVGYSQYRVNEKNKSDTKSDEAYVKMLGRLVLSEEFKKLSSQDKAIKFLQVVEKEKKDPILFFDFKDENFRSNLLSQDKFKDLLNLIESKDLDVKTFAKSFNDYREKRAETILGDGETCAPVMSVKKICEEVTAISSNERNVSKDAQTVEYTSSRDSAAISLDAKNFLNDLKKIFGSDFESIDFDVMMNARRCYAFNLVSRTGNRFDKTWADEYGENGTVSPASSAGPSTGSSSDSLTMGSYVSAGVSGKSSVKKAADYEGNGELADRLSNAISSGNQMPAVKDYSALYTPSSDDDTGSGKGKEESSKKDESNSSANNNQQGQNGFGGNSEKMNDLLKRLAAAEEKVDKMKSAAEEAENARVKQKKIDEENALIKELKSQISDLKNENSKKDADKAVAAAAVVPEGQRAPASTFGNSFNSKANAGRSDSSKGSESYDSKGSGAAVGGASGAAVKGGVNSAILTSSAAAVGAGVITALDGMSAEKATQTISSRILELKGKPFFIEEGGLLKEIVPVMKDGEFVLDDKGNPLYEKVTKGKVGDKKDKRAPASITDSADLKRDQEEKLKRERAEYIKLKNLTKDIMKQK